MIQTSRNNLLFTVFTLNITALKLGILNKVSNKISNLIKITEPYYVDAGPAPDENIFLALNGRSSFELSTKNTSSTVKAWSENWLQESTSNKNQLWQQNKLVPPVGEHWEKKLKRRSCIRLPIGRRFNRNTVLVR